MQTNDVKVQILQVRMHKNFLITRFPSLFFAVQVTKKCSAEVLL